MGFLTKKQEQITEINVGLVSYEKAKDLIRQFIATPEHYENDNEKAKVKKLELESMKGEKKAKQELIDYLVETMIRYKFEIEGMILHEAAIEIYKETWGLGIIEDIYHDPEVDEVEVNGIHNIYSIRRGRYCRENVIFNSEQELMALMGRIFVDYCAVNEGNPVGRTVRVDGTRVLATVPPFTNTITLTMRKHNTFIYSKDTLTQVGTLDPRIYDALALFNRGLLNILYSGPTNGGKTTMLRHFFRYSPPDIRTVLLEPRHELKLQENYPEWNIIEFQELPQQRLTLLQAFETALQVTPVRIITGEILGGREGPEAIKSGNRGHTGNLSTIHAETVEDAILELTNILVEEGRSQSITKEQAMERVCRAFDVIVQIFVPPQSGVKKVVAVGEPKFVDGTVKVINYFEWQPSEEDFLKGYWQYPNPLSERLIKKLHRNGVPAEELKRVGLIW
ncbi:type II secretion system protein E [Desulforamulus reducens MI-1]|uniref:Type II secretion system protein E n=1 Tax=Desulforamulus reducens (strain ATCC BAA-1160 / DSM 100696 / MI-1) TaxID=349161 RepID=A4J336_DESRM|nr:ATPase, T2SS/T4P/T4SS family [Desulforamulus reducens]ABO49489.1 type II secretion system protein E [Desulforamulus reducens MI-1]